MQLICEEPEEQELINDALRKVADGVDEPVRETLKDMLMGWEDGIVKDEFLSAFSNLDSSIDKWSLVCLFYYLDVEDVADEKVQLETIVRLVS